MHAYEEAELGLRLTDAGYKLRRLDIPYFSHTSHTLPTFKMLKHRWLSGYYRAPGELLRCSFGTPYFTRALKMVKNEAVFALYLLILLAALVTVNGSIITPGVAAITGVHTVENCAKSFSQRWGSKRH